MPVIACRDLFTIAAVAPVPRIAKLFLLDPRGVVTGGSAAALDEAGFAATELSETPFDRLFAADTPPGGCAAWLRAAATEGQVTIAGGLICKDGTRLPASVVIARLDTACGAALFTAVVSEMPPPDDGVLADSESQFRLLVQGVTDYAIYMLDPHGNIASWNPGGERIKGYREEEVIGRHFSLFYAAADRAKGEPQRNLAVAAREGRYEAEGWRVRKDGTRFWANAIIDAIRDAQGTLLGFAKITRDLTQKKTAEEALEETRAALAKSQKMEAIGQLTSGIAHDFNNLLTIIANAFDLLALPARDPAYERRIIDSAQRATERGARLTQQLLAFSRRQPLRPRICDVNGVIRGSEPVLRVACPAPIAVELNLSPVPLTVEIDLPQFEATLLNLIVNARDAMPSGGRLRISTRFETIGSARARAMSGIAPGDYVAVGVADTGEGMTAAVRARAFEPFFTTKEIGKGSGLGLSQVYGFVGQSGGHVAIDSEAGSGTTVTLYLPAVRLPAEARPADAAAAQPGAAKQRVLVVEDNFDVLDVTVETLRGMGYDVATAADAPTAIAILRREENIDILFSDIVMPRGMNGIELARTALRLRPHLRVLLASGYPLRALSGAERRGAGGEFAFLSKPYRAAELARALRALQPA